MALHGVEILVFWLNVLLSGSASGKEEDKPSRLASYLLKKGFAQNWFFKNDDEMVTEQAEEMQQQQAEMESGIFVFLKPLDAFFH